MKDIINNVSIIGDGGWGTTLGIHLLKQGYNVTIWGPFPKYLDYLGRHRINKNYLPGVRIPRGIVFCKDLTKAVQSANLVILAVPSKFVRSVLGKLRGSDLSQKKILSVVKGIEPSTLMRTSEILEKEFPKTPMAVLSGPTIASEVASGMPSSAVIASRNIRLAQQLQKAMHSKTFRLYTNKDVTGVEIGGSVKNVIAIACGVCDGLGFETNTKAALLTRGLAEITRLGQAMGAQRKTFAGLSGLGDLVTTCFSKRSRNRFVGEKLARGHTAKDITRKMHMVAEGITTVKAIQALSRRHRVAMPITGEVYRIIYKRKNPQKAVEDLMLRELKSE